MKIVIVLKQKFDRNRNCKNPTYIIIKKTNIVHILQHKNDQSEKKTT